MPLQRQRRLSCLLRLADTAFVCVDPELELIGSAWIARVMSANGALLVSSGLGSHNGAMQGQNVDRLNSFENQSRWGIDLFYAGKTLPLLQVFG